MLKVLYFVGATACLARLKQSIRMAHPDRMTYMVSHMDLWCSKVGCGHTGEASRRPYKHTWGLWSMNRPVRKNPRLSGFDYSQNGSYFITIVTANREQIFGDVTNGEMQPNRIGEIIAGCWIALQTYYRNVEIEDYIVMPNHLHGILTLTGDSYLLGTLVGSFKSATTRNIRALPDPPVTHIWQRGFHDHIIRDDTDRARICEYIHNNPARWHEDRYSNL